MKLNYKSDFDFILTLYGENGESIGFPTYDWEAYIYTASKAYKYKASCHGGECVNCFNDDGKIHIVANNHGLPVGALHIDFYSYLPNRLYPDGTERVVQPIDTDIELVSGPGDDAEGGDADVIIPYALVTSYDIAKANGYGGTMAEYNEALTRLPELKAEVDEVNALAEVIEAQSAAAQAAAEQAQEAAADAAEQAQEAATEQAAQAVRLTAVEAEAAALSEGKQDKLRSSEDVLVEGDILRIADLAKKKVFIDMWNAACTINGKRWGWYDEAADDFLIYPDFRNGEGLRLTYEEAVKCYVVSRKYSYNKMDSVNMLLEVPCVLPLRTFNQVGDLVQMFSDSKSIKAMAITDVNISGHMTSFCNKCFALEEVYGDLHHISNGINVGMYYCNALREIRIRSEKQNMSFPHSSLLSLASFQHMLTRSDNSVAITITVHKDCYAKMTGDTTNAAAAALTEEEAAQWQQLLADAVAKNITFATA